MAWNSYRTCTAFTSIILFISGLFLIAFWSSCYQHCLTRYDATYDAAAPLWTGIIATLVGIFGMFAAFLYWQPKNDIAFVFMNMILILCSIVCVALSIYASFKEWEAYEAASSTVENYTVLGVILFALMAFFAFMVLIVTVLWSCCFCSWRDMWQEPGHTMADPEPRMSVKVIEIPRYSVYGSRDYYNGYSSDIGRKSVPLVKRPHSPWWRSYRRRPYDPYYWSQRRPRRQRPRNWWMAYPPYDSSVSSVARLNSR